MTTSEPPFCASSPEAQAMPDDEFWARVYPSQEEADPEDDVPEEEFMRFDEMPCTECGEIGACTYDSQGRPMTHVQRNDDDE